MLISFANAALKSLLCSRFAGPRKSSGVVSRSSRAAFFCCMDCAFLTIIFLLYSFC